MKLRGKKVLVVGAARTGCALVRFLLKEGGRVTVSEISDSHHYQKIGEELRRQAVEVELGEHRTETFIQSDLIVPSPGVPLNLPQILEARSRGVEVISEIELAYRFLKIPLIAVTGTNGKTTTTALVGRILRRWGKKVFIGGNIGEPIILAPSSSHHYEIAVIEVSSFQLEGILHFRPHISLLLNLTEDHLDRHPSMEDYALAKAQIFRNQGPDDYLVFGGDDPRLSLLVKNCPAQPLPFSSRHEVEKGAYLLPDKIIYCNGSSPKEQYPLKGIRMVGNHNLENIMASITTARLLKCPPSLIQSSIESFPGLPHRIELVRTLRGVNFYNDSKATNVDSVKRALQALSSPLLLIMGGRDKGAHFETLKVEVKNRVKMLALYGEAGEKIYQALDGCAPAVIKETLEEALKHCWRCATAGDTILLSPGCASFDMFKDFEHRGECFKKLVFSLDKTG